MERKISRTSSIRSGSSSYFQSISSDTSPAFQWNPATIAFQAQYTPTFDTQAFWPSSRFLSGQHATWIDVPISLLSPSGCLNGVPVAHGLDDEGSSDYELVALIKLMLPSYLDQVAPSLAEAAEMAGLSARTFQRKLLQGGFSYSSLIEAARFENASRLLRNTDSKIIEIALSSGYADHTHFTRAFRRMAGVSPRQFREHSRERLSSLSE